MATADLPHVLVIGHLAPVREYVSRVKAAGRFRSTTVSDSAEAIAALRRMPVDVALVDVSDMPLRGGLRLAKRLGDEVRNLPVVVVANAPGIHAAAEAMRIGLFDYLLTPISTDELAAVINRAVEWRTSAVLSHGNSCDQEKQMELYALRLAAAIADGGIGSSGALDVYLATLYERDVATFEHARRVAAASVRIATSIGIGEPLLGHIERAALLHDIGQLAIPHPIVHTPTPLTSDEQMIVKSHVRVAFQALAGTPFLAAAAEIVLATRERYDGSGHPRGLAGAAIPIGARIIAVAEACDAPTSEHGLLESLSMRAATAQLVLEAGSRFDPYVVRAWLCCLDVSEDERLPNGGSAPPTRRIRCS